MFKKKEKKEGGFWADFKAFISKGSVLDMAVGVIIAGAFGAILTALTQGILMPIIALIVPSGGIDGIVTVLNHTAALPTADTANTVVYWGITYDADVINIINWGALINAVIYFLIVSFVLFIILRVAANMRKAREALKAKETVEQPVEPTPEPEPDPMLVAQQEQVALLKEIKKQLSKK